MHSESFSLMFLKNNNPHKEKQIFQNQDPKMKTKSRFEHKQNLYVAKLTSRVNFVKENWSYRPTYYYYHITMVWLFHTCSAFKQQNAAKNP